MCSFLKLFNNPLASCFLINLNFLLQSTTHIDKSIGFPVLLLQPSVFSFLYFFYTSNYSCSNVAKLSKVEKKNYIIKKKICVIFTKSFFFRRKYLFKINICIPFQKTSVKKIHSVKKFIL